MDMALLDPVEREVDLETIRGDACACHRGGGVVDFRTTVKPGVDVAIGGDVIGVRPNSHIRVHGLGEIQ